VGKLPVLKLFPSNNLIPNHIVTSGTKGIMATCQPSVTTTITTIFGGKITTSRRRAAANSNNSDIVGAVIMSPLSLVTTAVLGSVVNLKSIVSSWVLFLKFFLI
jgi:hypothetical protein